MLCARARARVCVCVCVHACVHVCMRAWVRVYVRAFCMCACKRECMCACVCTCRCMRTCVSFTYDMDRIYSFLAETKTVRRKLGINMHRNETHAHVSSTTQGRPCVHTFRYNLTTLHEVQCVMMSSDRGRTLSVLIVTSSTPFTIIWNDQLGHP